MYFILKKNFLTVQTFEKYQAMKSGLLRCSKTLVFKRERLVSVKKEKKTFRESRSGLRLPLY